LIGISTTEGGVQSVYPDKYLNYCITERGCIDVSLWVRVSAHYDAHGTNFL